MAKTKKKITGKIKTKINRNGTFSQILTLLRGRVFYFCRVVKFWNIIDNKLHLLLSGMRIPVIILTLLISVSSLIAQNDKGIISGIITDNENKSPLNEAEITIIELNKTSFTDSTGKFIFVDIPYGTYRVKISAPGYEAVVKTDVVVLSARPTEIVTGLTSRSYKTETIEVEAKYFQKKTDENTSNYNLDFEEVRRSPGSVEDVSRMVQVLPGVSPANDQRNDLIVRGGSPSENLTMIDGIEIPNINHYPSQGSSSGPIGMINVKFINDVNFSSGGFSAKHGDKLSSVMDIKFREGQRNRFLSDINLSTAGFGAVLEGPMLSKKGSYLFSFRRSYLNLIRSAIRISAVPNYWDFNLKTVYDINKKNKLEFIGIAGLDKIKFEGDAAEVSDENPYGNTKGNQEQFTVGFNLRTLFKKGYLQTTLANSSNYYYYILNDIKNNEVRFDYSSYESDFNLNTEILYQLSSNSNITIGVGGRYIKFKNVLYVRADTTAFGDPLPELDVNIKSDFKKASAFAQYSLKLFNDKVVFNTGLRYDYFSGINDKHIISPRAGLSIKLTPVTTLNLSTGIYTQAPEYLWVTSDPKNNNLKYIKSFHYVAGIEHLFAEDLRLIVEAYYKKYDNYPVSVYIPTLILVNGGTENGPNFVGEASSDGYGYVKGIDFSLHKKLTGSGFYGMLNYSLSKSEFTALKGGPKPGSFDYRHNLTVIAGYQLSNDWLIGIKYRYTTGRPYTPFDVQKSIIAGRGIYQTDKFNEARYKDYNRLDIRVDKKWNFSKVSIVAYVEMQNVFNTTNVYNYFWNEYKNEMGTIYQWAFLPVGGFSIQF